MTEGLLVALAFVSVLVVMPALLALAVEKAMPQRSRAERVLTADKVEARATLRYYNDVHDSHSG